MIPSVSVEKVKHVLKFSLKSVGFWSDHGLTCLRSLQLVSESRPQVFKLLVWNAI